MNTDPLEAGYDFYKLKLCFEQTIIRERNLVKIKLLN